MSIKSKVLATVATLATVGGVGTAGVLGTVVAATAATTSCGQTCIDIFSDEFGNHSSPNYILDVQGQGRTGQPVILYPASDSNPGEDFQVAMDGTVADLYAAHMVTAALALHYGCIPKVNFPDCFGQTKYAVNDPAFEIEYTPGGAYGGLCVGVACDCRARGGRDAAGVRFVQDGVGGRPVRPAGRLLLPRVRPGDQWVGHELQPAVRADLPAERCPDQHAEPAAAGRLPVWLHLWLAADPELPQHRQQPAVGRGLRTDLTGSSAGRPPEQFLDTPALALGRTARAAVAGSHHDSLLARRKGRALVDIALGGNRCADTLGDHPLDDHDVFAPFVMQPHLITGPDGVRGLDPYPVDPDVPGPAGTRRGRTGPGQPHRPDPAVHPPSLITCHPANCNAIRARWLRPACCLPQRADGQRHPATPDATARSLPPETPT